MLSSGTFGYGYEAIDLLDQNKIGCIINKSLTFEKGMAISIQEFTNLLLVC